MIDKKYMIYVYLIKAIPQCLCVSTCVVTELIGGDVEVIGVNVRGEDWGLSRSVVEWVTIIWDLRAWAVL